MNILGLLGVVGFTFASSVSGLHHKNALSVVTSENQNNGTIKKDIFFSWSDVLPSFNDVATSSNYFVYVSFDGLFTNSPSISQWGYTQYSTIQHDYLKYYDGVISGSLNDADAESASVGILVNFTTGNTNTKPVYNLGYTFVFYGNFEPYKLVYMNDCTLYDNFASGLINCEVFPLGGADTYITLKSTSGYSPSVFSLGYDNKVETFTNTNAYILPYYFYAERHDGDLGYSTFLTHNQTFSIQYYDFDPNAGLADSAYHDGYLDGADYGINRGYDIGYEIGVADGTQLGYDSGYRNGYDTGVLDANDYSFGSLFGAVADTPVLIIRNLFNFDFFGVNLLTVILSLFTGLIIFYLLRKLL